MHYDFIIVGGGLVGITLACALPTARIALIDQTSPTTKMDQRLLALTEGSCQFLKNLGLWPDLVEHASAIKQIHVSKRGQFGITRIHAKELNLPTLGYLIPAQQINIALEKKLLTLPHIELIRPARLQSLSQNTDGVTMTLDNALALTAKKLFAADGTQSTVRELLNIRTTVTDYQQDALVAIVQLQRDHDNIAYERFLKTGAIAMLPMQNQQAAMIWTDQREKITALKNLSAGEFLQTVQTHFGYRLGKLQTVFERQTYPLKFILAQETLREHIQLIGNAAHTMHPLAAQGLNIALHEIAQLLEKNPPTNQSAIKFSREKFSHHLLRFFSHDFLLLTILRQFGMIGFDVFSPIKKALMKHVMGRSGRIPSLLQAHDERKIYELREQD